MSPGQTGHITGQMGRVPGQTGRTPGGVPPKFFMFIGFFLSPSKRVPGVHGKRGLERGWQKRLTKGWRRVGRKG